LAAARRARAARPLPRTRRGPRRDGAGGGAVPPASARPLEHDEAARGEERRGGREQRLECAQRPVERRRDERAVREAARERIEEEREPLTLDELELGPAPPQLVGVAEEEQHRHGLVALERADREPRVGPEG